MQTPIPTNIDQIDGASARSETSCLRKRSSLLCDLFTFSYTLVDFFTWESLSVSQCAIYEQYPMEASLDSAVKNTWPRASNAGIEVDATLHNKGSGQ